MTYREEAGAPADAPIVRADGVDLAIARAGKGVPVVCLHATGHGARDFAPFADRVKESFEVLRVDWPGHGRSGPDHKPVSARRYAELVKAALDRLDVRAPIVVGCSIGGAAALALSELMPVRALVLCDSGGLNAITPALARICRTFAKFFAAGARGAWWYGPAFAAYMRIVLPSPKAAPQRKRIARACYETAPFVRDAWLSFCKPDYDMRAIAAALDVPVLFAWAMDDRIVSFSLVTDIIKTIKRATVRKFAGGHAAFLEQPARFEAEFRKFAATLGEAVAS
jgi:4,5:9,10-diseco-3-hydroxy-5,9,17-trioxoandrosta-1(10),2-diene-4-oate hydrolase